jgi:hypothetical protein
MTCRGHTSVIGRGWRTERYLDNTKIQWSLNGFNEHIGGFKYSSNESLRNLSRIIAQATPYGEQKREIRSSNYIFAKPHLKPSFSTISLSLACTWI